MNYRYLQAGETTIEGDEFKISPRTKEYMPIVEELLVSETMAKNKMFRRPIMADGQTPFWIELTSVVLVNMKSDGLSQGDLYEKLVEAAVEKFKANLQDHLSTLGENDTLVRIDRNNSDLENKFPF